MTAPRREPLAKERKSPLSERAIIALGSLQRFANHFFKNAGESPRASIPRNERYDDDLILHNYIVETDSELLEARERIAALQECVEFSLTFPPKRSAYADKSDWQEDWDEWFEKREALLSSAGRNADGTWGEPKAKDAKEGSE